MEDSNNDQGILVRLKSMRFDVVPFPLHWWTGAVLLRVRFHEVARRVLWMQQRAQPPRYEGRGYVQEERPAALVKSA